MESAKSLKPFEFLKADWCLFDYTLKGWEEELYILL